MSRNDKKSKFTQAKKSNTGVYVIAGVIIALLAVGGFMVAGKSGAADNGLENVGAVDYQGKVAEFARVTAVETGSDVVLDLNEIKDKKSVTFDVPGINFTMPNGTQFDYLPLLAYVSPKGNIMLATSLCEPCNGISFHIEGEQLVCDACGTRWTLEDLKGISGGCPDYPPDQIKYTLEGDKLVIAKTDLQNWKPREL